MVYITNSSTKRAISSENLLDRMFAITKNGFLPEAEPLRRLPQSYFAPWEEVMDQLSALVRDRSIRSAVDCLPILSTDKLVTEAEWRRAYSILSFLAHGYIWGGNSASEVLPPAITVPYLTVADKLQLPPVATYAALNLWNFTSSSNDFTDLDQLRSVHTLTGTEDESWFYCVSVAVEATGARIIPVMLDAIRASRSQDYQTVTSGLNRLTACIKDLNRILERMYEKCDPMVFYSQIRPYLAGSQNMASAGLPNGVFYDEGNGCGSWRQFRGGSNGQSSLIQFLDIVLGVKHGSDKETRGRSATGPSDNYHEQILYYMPGPHRQFLERVSDMSSIRDFVMGVAESQKELLLAFQAATTALGDFRNSHLQMVTRYIVIPSRRPCKTGDLNLASASSALQKDVGELTGTGGTALVPFLKENRYQTYLAGRIPLTEGREP